MSLTPKQARPPEDPPMSESGQQRKSSLALGMSAPGGRADVIRAKADIETARKSRADPSVNASLRSRYA